MKAVVYEKQKSGPVLQLREVEKPVAAEGEVLVKPVYTAINAADYRSMRMGIIPKSKIFGADVAGVVEAVGPGVKRLKVGDEVFGDLSAAFFGGFAEYAAAPEKYLALKPAGVAFDVAAAVPMASLTALQALRDQGHIEAGKKVLIYGAGGGVGNFAVQLARHFGAEVTAVCGSKNIDLVRSLGANEVIDYHHQDVTRGDKKFDLILGINGNRGLLEYRRILTPNGIFVVVGGGLSQVIKTMLLGWLLSFGGRKMRFLGARPSIDDLAFIIKLVEEGRIKPIIDRYYPLEQTAEAMQYLGEGHATGKVLIKI